MYNPTPLKDRRKPLLWSLGLGYLVLALLAAFDGGGISGLEWLSLLLGLVAGGLVVLSMRKIVPLAS